jgi:hypothetical protein
MPGSFSISGHDLFRYYYSLQTNQLSFTQQSPVDELNQLTGRLYDRQTWIDILEPYYSNLVNPTGNADAHL